MTEPNYGTIAAMELARAVDKFASYLHGIRPDLTHADSVMLMAAIIRALPNLCKNHPHLQSTIDNAIEELRKQHDN